LEKLEGVRTIQIQRREPTFHAALVGYTNAGKSTLMNSLAKGGVEAADRLFATLDSTTRRLFLGGTRKAVLSDTVGFIRKLPVGLVSSFKSTLGVASQASALIHVLDASADDFEEQSAITAGILAELGTEHLPRITAFNKIDLLDPERLEALKVQYPEALFVSAEKHLGLDPLRDRLRAVHDERAFSLGLNFKENTVTPHLLENQNTPTEEEERATREPLDSLETQSSSAFNSSPDSSH
jgi:GTP-binding protein HflX